jgi:hypothetical protein
MKDISAQDDAPGRASARKLIRSVVLAQGNIFIRELLRRKKLPIGVRKDEFEDHLLKAIQSGKLSLADVTQWLEEVEGWGDQHVYLYHVPRTIFADAVWKSPEAVKKKLAPAQRELWNATSLVFPKTWELTRIAYENRSLSYVWHQRIETLLRRPEKDFRQEIDGDWYQFRAFLERPDRAVLRFILQLDKRLAAVFMQIPIEGNAHDTARLMVQEATSSLVQWDALKPFSASDAIKNLDQAALEEKIAAKVRPKKTRLTDADNYVEFANTSEGGGYAQSTAVRSVRWAVKPENFAGNTGIFLYSARTPTQLERLVTIEVFGEQRRIKLRAQLKASEVWDILEMLRSSEQWRGNGRIGRH